MTMIPTGGIKEIVHILPPKGSYYPFRLKVIEKALKKDPESPVLPFLAMVVEAQQVVFNTLETTYKTHNFPKEEPFFIMDQEMIQRFQTAIITLTESLQAQLTKSDIQHEEISKVLEKLATAMQDNATVLESFQAILDLDVETISAENRLFLLAAMQATLHFEAAHLEVEKTYLLKAKDLCPCCKMPAISSVLDNSEDGLRYLYCSFCETKWHVVRSQCTECMSNKSLFQNKIEELGSPMSAEVCDECHTYLKFLDRTKTIYADPFIDDLLTLPLAIKLAEEDYKTYGLNPYFI